MKRSLTSFPCSARQKADKEPDATSLNFVKCLSVFIFVVSTNDANATDNQLAQKVEVLGCFHSMMSSSAPFSGSRYIQVSLSSQDVLRGRHTLWFIFYRKAGALGSFINDLSVASQPAQDSNPAGSNSEARALARLLVVNYVLALLFPEFRDALVSFIDALGTYARANKWAVACGRAGECVKADLLAHPAGQAHSRW